MEPNKHHYKYCFSHLISLNRVQVILGTDNEHWLDSFLNNVLQSCHDFLPLPRLPEFTDSSDSSCLLKPISYTTHNNNTSQMVANYRRSGNFHKLH